jgi:hypothetical protein
MANKNKKHFKKNNQRIIFEDYKDYLDLNEHNLSKKFYENYDYFSAKEKNNFDSKFSVPKNSSQKYYMRQLQKKTNKIIIATGY